MTDEELLEGYINHEADKILHNDFSREPQRDLYRQVGGVVVGRLGYWVLADRNGRAIYGHA
ncbi:MAG: hypothetical protein A4E19_17995 [Nitrospira sp. SG-bin1]|nr:MAG: hypothetical protein A4E19_17995 [Nitrospira sp. SG-bin1]